MQVSKQMVLISGRIIRPRVKDWPDMWCFPGQGWGSNVSMARSQDQSPLVPVLSSLTPPLRFCPFSIHKIGLVVGLSSGAPVMLSSPPWCPLLSSWWSMVMTSPMPMLLPLVIWSGPGPGADSFIKCWRAGGVLRPGHTLLQEVSSRQRAATRHHHDPPAKRWMKFLSSLHYANFCTRQHSPTSWNCWDFIPNIPSSKY